MNVAMMPALTAVGTAQLQASVPQTGRKCVCQCRQCYCKSCGRLYRPEPDPPELTELFRRAVDGLSLR